MSLEQKYNLIEQYISGKLTGAALRTFEQKMRNNPELTAEVELHQQVANALSDDAFWSFEELVKEVGSEVENQGPVIAEDELPTIDLAEYVSKEPAQIPSISIPERQDKPKKQRSSRRNTGTTKVIRFYKRMLTAAAMLIVLLSAGLLFMLFNNNSSQTASNGNLTNSEKVQNDANVAQVDPVVKEKPVKTEMKGKQPEVNRSNSATYADRVDVNENLASSTAFTSGNNSTFTLDEVARVIDILEKEGYNFEDELPEYGLLNKDGTTRHPRHTTANSDQSKATNYKRPAIELNKHDLAMAKFVLEGTYDTVYDFYNNIAKVSKNGRYGYIKFVFDEESDKIFKPLVPPIYEEAKDFRDNLAEVKKNGSWRMINVEGKEVAK